MPDKKFVKKKGSGKIHVSTVEPKEEVRWVRDPVFGERVRVLIPFTETVCGHSLESKELEHLSEEDARIVQFTTSVQLCDHCRYWLKGYEFGKQNKENV